MLTKQQIYEEKERLDGVVHVVANAAGDSMSLDWFAAGHRTLVSQRPARDSLEADCANSGGHLFGGLHANTCRICGADKNAGRKQLSANVLKG